MSQPHRSGNRALRGALLSSPRARTRRGVAAFGSALALAFAAVGCGGSTAEKISKYPLGPVAAALPTGQSGVWRREILQRELPKFFGTPAEPVLWDMRADEDSPYLIAGGDPSQGHTKHLQVGRDLFRRHCLHCHGIWGLGDGTTAQWLNPRPRNFWKGKFKFKSTTAPKPTREDLKRTIRMGAHGTAMPSFKVLEDDKLGALAAARVNGDREWVRAFKGGLTALDYLADYVIYLAMYGEVSEKAAADIRDSSETDGTKMGTEAIAILTDWYQSRRDQWVKAATQSITLEGTRHGFHDDGTIDWPAMGASVRRGRQLFLSKKAECHTCHGKEAKGTPTPDLRDSWHKTFLAGDGWEQEPQPANLTMGWYHGGGRAKDIYYRLTTGIDPMPSFAGTLTPDQRWDLVNYVRAVPYWGADLKHTPTPAKAKGD